MFRRRKQGTPPQAAPEPFTYVHHGTVIEGRLTATGRVRVHGTLRGDVNVAGVLEVATSGVVECEHLTAHDVKVVGRVVATRLEAAGKVEIWKGGELVGDVFAAALDIEDGAHFTGRSEMVTSSSAPLADAALLPPPTTSD